MTLSSLSAVLSSFVEADLVEADLQVGLTLRGASGLPAELCGQLIGASIADDLIMNVRYVIGSLLVVIGLVSLLLGGFRWTKQKTVIDVGPLKATTEEHKTLPIPPVVGALALIGGIVVLVVPIRRRA